eukprot:Nk52_evm1s1276 gene=Nk52_evmTU1s1276
MGEEEAKGGGGGGLYMLDYGAGNVRSLLNAIHKLGYDIKVISCVEDFKAADKLIFPGVGSFGAAVSQLKERGYWDALLEYVHEEKKPFFGICVGMQLLFEGSEESPGIGGLGVIPAMIKRFDDNSECSIPHMGWNGVNIRRNCNESSPSSVMSTLMGPDSKFYFVHSYMAPFSREKASEGKGGSKSASAWTFSVTSYGGEEFISSVRCGNKFATQFHPEKSGADGLNLIKAFLDGTIFSDKEEEESAKLGEFPNVPTELSKRIIACLDVRENEHGDLVVTKGDQYDVKEEGLVRNLGKPVEIAQKYFEDGADEITFLNITSFRNIPLKDAPMLEVLKRTSRNVFVPLTIGGGIRDVTDPDGTFHSALAVASEYFRSGADKVSIGSDAVFAAEGFIASGGVKTGKTSIEQIANVYGNQAVVISIDPKRVYVNKPEDTPHHVIETCIPPPVAESGAPVGGKYFCWFQCTVKGGRESRDIGVHEVVRACEALGAGEILVNSMDRDGTNSGFDIELVAMVKSAVRIPVIASSGAGNAGHFVELFRETNVDAGLAAGIFHRNEVPLKEVKATVRKSGVEVRNVQF